LANSFTYTSWILFRLQKWLLHVPSRVPIFRWRHFKHMSFAVIVYSEKSWPAWYSIIKGSSL
jgi:hypothetical protein